MNRLALFLVPLVVACGSSTPATEPAQTPAAGTSLADPSATSPADPGATSPAGESKMHAEGGMCGGLAGFGCNEGLYCLFPPEAHCGAADQTGACTRVPDMCTKEFAPVCGCNDKTYSNACMAAHEGISVVRKGDCAAPVQ